ncbi:SH3-like domain-containing protein, partial [Enterococcus faecalis]|uniref:SH3-like domain-containing protein n=1 Tax=Enterococcus faecalis TaxID=1351 RepID=UPI003F4730E0
IQYFEYSEYGSVPWGTRGYQSLGVLKNSIGKTVEITKEVTTSGNNTYYEFELKNSFNAVFSVCFDSFYFNIQFSMNECFESRPLKTEQSKDEMCISVIFLRKEV